MSTKIASMIATVITALFIAPILLVFGGSGLVVLNGFMNADVAVYTGLACLGITLILCPVVAWWLTKTFISRLQWNSILSIAVSVIASTVLGGVLGFGTIVVMAIVAEAM